MRVLRGVVNGNVQLHWPVVGGCNIVVAVCGSELPDSMASFSTKLVWLSVVEIEGRSIKSLAFIGHIGMVTTLRLFTFSELSVGASKGLNCCWLHVDKIRSVFQFQYEAKYGQYLQNDGKYDQYCNVIVNTVSKTS